MKNFTLAVGVLAISAVLINASIWEGAAVEDGAGGDLPKTGYYAATNSFPRNTVVEVMNLETGQKTRAVVFAGLKTPGLLATLSRDAAIAIGLGDSGRGDRLVGRVQMNPDMPEGTIITPVVYYPESHIERGEYPEFFSPPVSLIGDEDSISEPEISWDAISAADVQPLLLPVDSSPPVFIPPSIVAAPIVVREIPYETGTGNQERQSLADPAFSLTQFQFVPAEERPPVYTPETVPPGPEAPQIRSQIQAGTGGEQRIVIEILPLTRGQTAPQPPVPVPAPDPVPQAPPPPSPVQEPYLDPSLFIAPISPPAAQPAPVPAPAPVPYYIPVPVPAPAPQVSPPPPAPTPVRFSVPLIGGLEPGKYYLQLGVYGRPGAVEDELTRIGRTYPLVVQNGGSASAPLYRILLGPVSKGESGALLQRFKGRGYTDAFVRSGS